MPLRFAMLVIWIAGVILIMMSGLKNPGNYVLIVFLLIQLFVLASLYKKVNRKFEGEVLIQSETPVTARTFLFQMATFIVISTAYVFVFSKYEKTFWIVIQAIIVSTGTAGYFIVKGRRIPFLILSDGELIMNEMAIKRYDLEKLEEISYDGFNENYTFIFSNAQKFILRPVKYKVADMNAVIAIIKSRSGREVGLSKNLLPFVN